MFFLLIKLHLKNTPFFSKDYHRIINKFLFKSSINERNTTVVVPIQTSRAYY